MNVIKTVVVKQVLTEHRKQQLLAEITKEKTQYLKEIEQLKFQLHKKVKGFKGNRERLHDIKVGFQNEWKQREEKIKNIEFKVHQLNKLTVGTELKERTMESLYDVRVGDSWDDIVAPTEIIIKDGVVHEIRKGRLHDDKLV